VTSTGPTELAFGNPTVGSQAKLRTQQRGAVVSASVLLVILPVVALLIYGIFVLAEEVRDHSASAKRNNYNAADRWWEEHQARLRWEEHQARQQRIGFFGAKNAALVEAAQYAVNRVVGSEAARTGWLGDVDFTADLRGIMETFRQAHDLSRVAYPLSVLENPSAEDRRILADANATIVKLEAAAFPRVELIKKCALEVELIDKSLHDERQEAKTAGQRAELSAKLSAMLYGIKATPDATPIETATDAVIARVWAYREIKNQIQHVRNNSL